MNVRALFDKHSAVDKLVDLYPLQPFPYKNSHPFGLFCVIRPFEPHFYSENVRECFGVKMTFRCKEVMPLA